MAEYLIQGETLTNMADEIRTLSGTTGTMNPNEMTEHVADANAEITSQDALLDQAITALEGKAAGSGGGSAEPVLQEKTVSPSTSQQSVTPDSGYDGLSKVTVNAMPAGSVANPSISVGSSGLITATSAVNAGYVDGTDKTGTKQLTTQAAKTITPTKSSQTAVASGRYTTGAVTVAAIPSAYQDVTGVDAVAVDVVEGKKIVNSSGETVTGTNPYVKATTDTEVNSQATKLAELKTILEGKAAGGGSGPLYEEVESFTYSVNPISGASYGFSQNSNGYWESENKGIHSSYAICRVNFEVVASCDITFEYINHAESNSDYGIFGILDTALSLSNTSDSKIYAKLKSSSSVKELTYTNVQEGSHFIDIKYIKDSSDSEDNDTLQFKVQAAPIGKLVNEEMLERIQAADDDLIPENIIEGIKIFGVQGTHGTTKVVSGSFTPASTDLYSTPIEITGLGFKPKFVIIDSQTVTTNTGSLPEGLPRYVLNTIAVGGEITMGISRWDEQTGTLYRRSDGLYSIEMNDDGFILKASISSSYIYAACLYYYTAIG